MRLHQDTGFFLVAIAQILPRFDRLGKPRIEIASLRDAPAVRASPAKVRKSMRLCKIQTVQHLRQHQSQGVLARAAAAR